MRALEDDPGLGTALPNIISFVEILLFIILANQAGAAAGSRGEVPVRPPVMKTAGDGVGRPTRVLSIVIDSRDKYHVFGDDASITAEEMRAAIGRSKPGTAVKIVADGRASHAATAEVMDAAREAGRDFFFEVRKPGGRR